MSQRVHEQLVLRASEGRAREFAAEQAAVVRVATAVAAGAEPDVVFGLVADQAASVLGAELAVVARFEADRIETVGTHGLVEAPASATMLLLGADGVVDEVRTQGTAVRRAGGGVLDARCAAAAPVRVGGQLWGALAVADIDEAGLPDGAEIRLGRFAELVAMAIVNADTRAELAARATTDALTGLPNKAAFHERLEVEVERARRGGHALAWSSSTSTCSSTSTTTTATRSATTCWPRRPDGSGRWPTWRPARPGRRRGVRLDHARHGRARRGRGRRPRSRRALGEPFPASAR
jgi:hypothetical protein